MSDERIIQPISDAELERRWSAVRAVMERDGLDAVVLQNASDWVGGYVKWFTDLPATNGYPRTVIFHREGPMTMIEMGPFGSRRELDGKDPVQRGVGLVRNTPSFMSVNYTLGYDAQIALEELKSRNYRRIGCINMGALPYSLVSALQEGLGNVQLVDCTDAIDTIKAIKRPEEIGLLYRCAHLQDEVFAKVLGMIRPGLRDIDVTAFVQAECMKLGSEQGIQLGHSAPLGVRSGFIGRHFQGRTMRQGDHLSLLIEVNGPGGFYTEIARTIVLGKATQELKDAFASVKAAQDYTLSLMVPGTRCADIARAHDEWMKAHGLPPETRLYSHGQGYDMVERPLIRADETMVLEAGMCLAVHPGYETAELFGVICDNYMIEASGPSACMHRTEKRIFEV
jgi:Xaa-Pro aminopeptidase